ncbi:MAG: histidinol-phosphatase [Clostridia bacterium]|nr:histidinol-phosphatase [Clostridia bacterium]
MIKFDLHAHTTFCDGKNTPEEMILSAIDKGVETMGLLLHSYLSFYPTGSCKSLEHEQAFVKEMATLKVKYADKIKVLCGIEMEYFSPHEPKNFDYVIGSVHFFKVDGKYYAIDHSPKIFDESVKEAFNGDYLAAAEDYYKNVADVVRATNADIIGHFDLITKFNENNIRFDTSHPRYVKAATDAIDALIPYNKPFEINTGAISRGYRLEPYPSKKLVDYIKSKGGKLIMSSDSHHKDNIGFKFDEWSFLAE